MLVSKHQQNGVSEVVLLQHIMQFSFRLGHSFSIVGVYDEYQSLGVLEVVPPQRTDFVLAAHVPHRERDVFIFYRLDVETDRRYGRDDLAQLQFVEYGSLAGGVQADHQYAHLLFTKQTGENRRQRQAHGKCASETIYLKDKHLKFV